MLVSQDIEAEIGFASAIAMSDLISDRSSNDGSDTGKCVWDSGGASFQITHKNTSSSISSLTSPQQMISTYMGAIGTSVSLSILLQDVRGGVMQQNNDMINTTVNPVSRNECDQFIAVLRSKLSNELPAWLLNRKCVIAAAGSNSLFKLCCIILQIESRQSLTAVTNNSGNKTTNDIVNDSDNTSADNQNDSKPVTYFTLSQAEEVLSLCLDRTDQELIKYQQFPYAEGTNVIIPKLALLIAVMRHTGIQSIHSVDCIGSCAGVLCDDRFWL